MIRDDEQDHKIRELEHKVSILAGALKELIHYTKQCAKDSWTAGQIGDIKDKMRGWR